MLAYIRRAKRIYIYRAVRVYVCTREWTRSVGGCCTRDGVRILYVGDGPGRAVPVQWWRKSIVVGFSCKHSSKQLSVISLGPDALNSKASYAPGRPPLVPPVNEPTRITPTTRRSPVTSPSGRPRPAELVVVLLLLLPSTSPPYIIITPSSFSILSYIPRACRMLVLTQLYTQH